MVPLTEAWDSSASAWTPLRREAYANDQGAQTSLVAGTARSHRSKTDQGPAAWPLPASDVRCRYPAEWAGTKLRWALAVTDVELDALESVSVGCPEQTVTYEPALRVRHQPRPAACERGLRRVPHARRPWRELADAGTRQPCPDRISVTGRAWAVSPARPRAGVPVTDVITHPPRCGPVSRYPRPATAPAYKRSCRRWACAAAGRTGRAVLLGRQAGPQGPRCPRGGRRRDGRG